MHASNNRVSKSVKEKKNRIEKRNRQIHTVRNFQYHSANNWENQTENQKNSTIHQHYQPTESNQFIEHSLHQKWNIFKCPQKILLDGPYHGP